MTLCNVRLRRNVHQTLLEYEKLNEYPKESIHSAKMSDHFFHSKTKKECASQPATSHDEQFQTSAKFLDQGCFKPLRLNWPLLCAHSVSSFFCEAFHKSIILGLCSNCSCLSGLSLSQHSAKRFISPSLWVYVQIAHALWQVWACLSTVIAIRSIPLTAAVTRDAAQRTQFLPGMEQHPSTGHIEHTLLKWQFDMIILPNQNNRLDSELLGYIPAQKHHSTAKANLVILEAFQYGH